MSPASSTMAQRPLAVHETPPVQLLAPVASTGAPTQADAPPVGSVDATSSPTESPAAHSEVVGHEMAPIQLPESTLFGSRRRRHRSGRSR